MLDDYFRQYGLIVILSVIAVIIPTSMIAVSWFLSVIKIRPTNPNPVKLSIYECGMETIGPRWNQFNFRYYYFALLFVLFDVETVFLYPWAVHFRKLGLFALIEMGVFIGILVVGWVYAWRKKALEWR
ncbi:MAG: NADH-quinone oxidoreductase subunit A [Chloroflexi bacterium]|nr:NADH-quinone oxidoreductase subunit A [Chloroflexota bacterium]